MPASAQREKMTFTVEVAHKGLTRSYSFRVRRQAPNAAGEVRQTLLLKTTTGEKSIQTVDTRKECDQLALVVARRLIREEAQAKAEAVKAAPAPAHEELCGVTFSTYFETHFIRHRRLEESSRDFYRAMYRTSLGPAFGDLDLRKITKEVIKEWITKQVEQGEDSNDLINRRMEALQTILFAKDGECAADRGLVVHNPLYRIQKLKTIEREPQTYTPEEVDRLVAAADPWFSPAVLTKSATACRRSELRAIRVRDINPINLTVTLAGAINQRRDGSFYWKARKNNKEHTVPVEAEAMVVLLRVIQERQLGPDDLVFAQSAQRRPARTRHRRQTAILEFVDVNPGASLRQIAEAVGGKYHMVRLEVKVLVEEGCLGVSEVVGNWQELYTVLTKERHIPNTILRTEEHPNGVPFSNSWLADCWKDAVTAAGLPWRRPHDLRASMISWVLAGSADPQAAMALADHEDWRTTKRYNVHHPGVHQSLREALQRGREVYARAAGQAATVTELRSAAG